MSLPVPSTSQSTDHLGLCSTFSTTCLRLGNPNRWFGRCLGILTKKWPHRWHRCPRGAGREVAALRRVGHLCVLLRAHDLVQPGAYMASISSLQQHELCDAGALAIQTRPVATSHLLCGHCMDGTNRRAAKQTKRTKDATPTFLIKKRRESQTLFRGIIIERCGRQSLTQNRTIIPPPPPCASTRKVRKTTVRPGPGAWTRRCLRATRGTS